MKKQWMAFCLVVISVSMMHAAGKADDLVRSAGKKLTKEALKSGAKRADDAIRYASRHVDDWRKLVVYKLDDSVRPLSRKADDFVRLSVRHGDDVIYDFGKVHSRIAKTLGTKTDNVVSITAKKYAKYTDNVAETLDGPLKKNTIYRQYQAEHEYFTGTDSFGRVKEVFARNPHRKTYTGRLGDNVSSGDLRHMGYDILPGDEGGHLIPDFLCGSRWNDNIVPMSQKLNRGSGSKWRSMETTLDGYIQAGEKIENYHVQVKYPSPASKRPSRFKVEYDVDGSHFIKYFSNNP